MRVTVVGKPLTHKGVYYRVGEKLGLSDDLAESLIGRGSVESAAAPDSSTGVEVQTSSLTAPTRHKQARARRRRPSKRG